MKIAFGTDVGGFSWNDPIAKEFPYLVEFGMTPMAAIQSATTGAAEMLGMSGRLGVVAPGAWADVVAVPGDPLADVKELGKVFFVMKDGKVFRNDARAETELLQPFDEIEIRQHARIGVGVERPVRREKDR